MSSRVLVAIVALIGFGFIGLQIGGGLKGFSSGNRVVVVKGVSEREVEADVAFWPVRFSVSGPNLELSEQKLSKQRLIIIDYFKRYGVEDDLISPQALEVNDASLQLYGGNDGRGIENRIIITQTLLVKSNQPKLILEASRNIDKLLALGVNVSVSSDYGSGPTYLFTNLNKFKPEMIAEAIRNARESGEQFAKDSKTNLGAIKTANQGVFEVQPRFRFENSVEEKQIEKLLRVVTTVHFYLN